MGDRTAIAWTEKTWNPWQGCHKVSAGCAHCYMYSEKIRYGQRPSIVVRSRPATFNAPLRWKDPARVFTCSWSDWFVEEADAWRDEAWEIVRRTPHLTYQILTKRPERIAAHLPADWPLPNVWLGVSVENQAAADDRLPHLLATPAAVRFVSAEPLLGPVDLRAQNDPLTRTCCRREDLAPPTGCDGPGCNGTRIDWVIVGGESGPKARPCDLTWIRSLLEQCRAATVPVFVKQLGAKPWRCLGHDRAPAMGVGAPVRCDGVGTYCPHLSLHDRKGGDPAEWPADLRVREFPHIERGPERRPGR